MTLLKFMAAIAITFAVPSKGHAEMSTQQQTHPYVGIWGTADGRIRHNLLPNNRYDEARGTRESAYQGRYEGAGNPDRILGRYRLHRRRNLRR